MAAFRYGIGGRLARFSARRDRPCGTDADTSAHLLLDAYEAPPKRGQSSVLSSPGSPFSIGGSTLSRVRFAADTTKPAIASG